MNEFFDGRLELWPFKAFPIYLYRKTIQWPPTGYVNGATSGDDLYRLLQICYMDAYGWV